MVSRVQLHIAKLISWKIYHMIQIQYILMQLFYYNLLMQGVKFFPVFS